MFKNIIITCVLGVLTIALGAFGAHALKNILSPQELISFETAVRYQMYHVIVLLFVNTYAGFNLSQKNRLSYIYFLGIFLFSGSIYAIYLTPISPKDIWFITPIGGLTLILGWIFMIVIFLKKSTNNK